MVIARSLTDSVFEILCSPLFINPRISPINFLYAVFVFTDAPVILPALSGRRVMRIREKVGMYTDGYTRSSSGSLRILFSPGDLAIGSHKKLFGSYVQFYHFIFVIIIFGQADEFL